MPQIISNGKGGYWVCFSDGAVNAFGGANYHGGANALKPPPKSPIISMTASPSGEGYWQLAKDKSIFAFGDAQYAGHP